MASQYVYLLHVTRPEMLVSGASEYEAEVLAEHFSYLTELKESGIVLMAGRTQTDHPETLGIVILVAEDEQAATAVMQADPAVANNVMTAQVFPYQIALISDQITTLV